VIGSTVKSLRKFSAVNKLKLASGKQPTDRLFKSHTPRWLLTNVKRICRLAGVPEVCTHALRGTHSTLATEHGVTGHAVTASLGHESVTTTYANYATPSAVANAKSRRVAEAIGVAQ
jgi:integrase